MCKNCKLQETARAHDPALIRDVRPEVVCGRIFVIESCAVLDLYIPVILYTVIHYRYLLAIIPAIYCIIYCIIYEITSIKCIVDSCIIV